MQLALMHETLNDALRETVQALGGTKKVGCTLWPEMTADHASSRLRDCLNQDRREKLSPEQVEMIGRMGRQAGCHAIMAYMARTMGYADPVPVEPEDELAKQQREFVAATQALMKMAERIEATQAMAAKLQRVA
jgi:hypothetical protein